METRDDIFVNNLKLDATGKRHLRSIAASATVIVIVAGVTYLLDIWRYFQQRNNIVIAQEGFIRGYLSSKMDATSLIITIVIGLLINFFLVRFIMLSKDSIRNNDTTRLSLAIRQLKTYFIIFVIFSILIGCIFLVLLLIAISTKR